MAKILLIVAIALSLITAGLGYLNHTTLQTTKDDLATTQGKLSTTNGQLDATKKELGTLKTTLETTNGDLAKATQDLAATKTELETANKTAADAKADAEAKVAQIQTLTEENEKLKIQLTGTTSTGPGPVEDPRIPELTAQVESLNEKMKGQADELAAYKQKEEQHKKSVMKEGLEGRVLAVNPAWNFVVLSIGDRQGVVNNAEMLLKRGGQYLGKVRITSVEPATSIADIVANSMPSGVAVQPGDSVIFQSSTQD